MCRRWGSPGPIVSGFFGVIGSGGRTGSRRRPTSGLLALAIVCGGLMLAASPLAATQATGTPDQVGQWSAPISWPEVAVHMALQPNGSVLVFDGFGAAPNSERLWNPSTGAFVPVPYGRNLFCSGHVGLGDGRTLILGGHVNANVGLADTTIFDSKTNTWFRGPDMTVGRWYPTATLLPDGRTLVFSGDNIVQDRPGAAPPARGSTSSIPRTPAGSWSSWSSRPPVTDLGPHDRRDGPIDDPPTGGNLAATLAPDTGRGETGGVVRDRPHHVPAGVTRRYLQPRS